jgi:hypothetical protein
MKLLFNFTRRKRAWHTWVLLTLGLWCAVYLVQYAREYAPFFGVRMSSLRIELRKPVDSYCTMHPKAKKLPAASALRTRELVLAVSAESSLTPAQISGMLATHWAELAGGRRAPLLEPRATREARKTPASIWHLSTTRTILLLGRGIKNEARILHESHLRLCPRDTY